MALLKFTLSAEGVGALREALACLSKFSDEVSLEAKKDRLVLTALNSSKSAYACFSFASNRFFSKFTFDGAAQHRDRFFCMLYNRALLSLFRARSGDPLHDREKDTTIDRCDVAVEDEADKNTRFIVRIVCRNGITTKYRLPFEVSPPVHAKFDQDEAVNGWGISSRTLRQLMDHFGPGIEYLDIHSDDDEVVNFTCFTEAKSAQSDAEVLKKPLHTSIAVEREEFEHFEVDEDKLHIVISVKDFRAIIQHAGALGSNLSARYSMPARPMQLRYEGDGIKCEFLLMTVGERGAPGQKSKKPRGHTKTPKGPQLEEATSRATSHAPTPAPQPFQPSRQAVPIPSLRPTLSRPSQRPPPPALESEALFVPQDTDHQWDPVNFGGEDEEEEENGRLEWDASNEPNPTGMNMRSILSFRNAQISAYDGRPEPAPSDIEPTQRLSEVRKFGLFGE